MALTEKKLSEYSDITSGQIDATTRVPTITGSPLTNKNLKISDLVVDDLNTSNSFRPLSSKMGKKLQDEKAPLLNPVFSGTVSGLDKSMVGLDNVDNTSDLLKPISNATKSAIDWKADKSELTYYKPKTIPISTNGDSFSLNDIETLVYMTTDATTFTLNTAIVPTVGTKIIFKNANVASSSIVGTDLVVDGENRDPVSGTPLVLSGAYSKMTIMFVAGKSWVTI